MNLVAVIPAYRPGAALRNLARQLTAAGFEHVVVVDDGSGPAFAPLFDDLRSSPGVTVLDHAVNMGKGAALKTGFNHVLCHFPAAAGVVTVDADGQHAIEDVLRVARRLIAEPGSVVLGVRQFAGQAGIPWRSRVGNRLTASAVRLLIGQRLADTQTGLRGLPFQFLPHLLRIRSTGYEFELDMLIACRHHDYTLAEEPVAAIYLDGNRSSHFNPLLDSLRIYFVLLRFAFVSLLSSLIDNLVFLQVLPLVDEWGFAQLASRSVAIGFNYFAARSAVFLSREPHSATLPRYLLLVAASGLISYGLIQYLVSHTRQPVIVCKILVEVTLFAGNFALQRDFVFRKRREGSAEGDATDWDRYYRETSPTAHFTRRFTRNSLLSFLSQCGGPERPVLLELGGANSCFLNAIVERMRPAEYHVLDTNRHGLDLLERRAPEIPSRIVCHEDDCRQPSLHMQADIVLSVGLIEHFDPAGTRQAIATHFQLLKPGGFALISYPTPTWLYRTARALVSSIGLWRFPDERPLQREEVMSAIRQHGEVVGEKLLWPVVFTQRMMLVRKR